MAKTSQAAKATEESSPVAYALHSTVHRAVTCTVDDVPYTVTFPAVIGDGEGQIPQAVADVLVGLSFLPGEYAIVAEVDDPTHTGDA